MILTIPELPALRERHKDKRIVFCSGSFDLPHAGHILFFEDCKKHGNILVVGVGGDAIIKKNKGEERPILNENVRLKTIDSFKPVDAVVLDDVSQNVHPLYFLEEIFQALRPDIYIVNNDAFNPTFREELVKKFNIELKVLERWCEEAFDGISTTKIIEKIKKLGIK